MTNIVHFIRNLKKQQSILYLILEMGWGHVIGAQGPLLRKTVVGFLILVPLFLR